MFRIDKAISNLNLIGGKRRHSALIKSIAGENSICDCVDYVLCEVTHLRTISSRENCLV
jgi:hypothetical protein